MRATGLSGCPAVQAAGASAGAVWQSRRAPQGVARSDGVSERQDGSGGGNTGRYYVGLNGASGCESISGNRAAGLGPGWPVQGLPHSGAEGGKRTLTWSYGSC